MVILYKDSTTSSDTSITYNGIGLIRIWIPQDRRVAQQPLDGVECQPGLLPTLKLVPSFLNESIEGGCNPREIRHKLPEVVGQSQELLHSKNGSGHLPVLQHRNLARVRSDAFTRKDVSQILDLLSEKVAFTEVEMKITSLQLVVRVQSSALSP
jgi:hypothetical protein